jgi:uncharacterized protein involved in exopolysaccharide biosynthesis
LIRASAEELEELRAEHFKASNHAAEMVRKYGAQSPQCAEADKIAADLSARILELEERASQGG